ncbi:hypothetical protein D6C87_10334 [Aureobasidium pullulans]|uniref:Myb-like domain-containing protein n=1 Tax=Aureobasidium pullulans TaxID=5580 RepID=A0AB38LN27_AURPU|nr:hypothetical protein D6C94_08455 [Aureobasidium pullulans]THZ34603.1 hypothetical protein D6C87_10334 [Aureobasidium pullulans]
MSSDNESTKGGSPAKTEKKAVVFTDREEMVLKVAWRCLKSGPPEIDIEKLTKAAGFNTQKTCSNMWSGLKKKLLTDVDGNALPTAPGRHRLFHNLSNSLTTSAIATPKPTKGKKGTATPAKKRAKKDVDDDEDDEDEGRSIAKKTKPSPVKKVLIKAEDSDEE